MKTTLLFLSVFLATSVLRSQSANNPAHPIIYGIDLNATWYDLTNSSAYYYYLADESPDSKNDPYVMTDLISSDSIIESVFKNLLFNELLLGFPKGKSNELKSLKPDLLICRKNYESDIAFATKAEDFRIVLEGLMMRVFGQGEIAFLNENVYTYKWENDIYQVILSSVKEYNQVVFYYLKKRD